MADLTGVAVTDAFCYRLRRWRTDSPSRKGEARRGATHSPLEGWMHSPSSSVASLVFRKCLLSQMYNIANKSLKTHNEPESFKKILVEPGMKWRFIYCMMSHGVYMSVS